MLRSAPKGDLQSAQQISTMRIDRSSRMVVEGAPVERGILAAALAAEQQGPASNRPGSIDRHEPSILQASAAEQPQLHRQRDRIEIIAERNGARMLSRVTSTLSSEEVAQAGRTGSAPPVEKMISSIGRRLVGKRRPIEMAADAAGT